MDLFPNQFYFDNPPKKISGKEHFYTRKILRLTLENLKQMQQSKLLTVQIINFLETSLISKLSFFVRYLSIFQGAKHNFMLSGFRANHSIFDIL